MLALLFIILFPFIIWSLSKTLRTARASAAWPTVSGTITKVERFKRLFRSLPRVGYSYTVDGQEYQSERISFATGYRPQEVEKILSRYRVGQTVPVSYAPGKPAEAVLEPGEHPQIKATIRLLVIFFVVLLVLNIVRFFMAS